MYRKILVSGGSGLLGTAFKAVAPEYPDREFRFFDSAECDLRDAGKTAHFVGSQRPDAIVHLAAVAGGVELSMKRPATLLRDNVVMDLNVLEAARLCGVGKTVMTLSSGMYPEDAANPIGEAALHAGAPHASNYSYAYAKRLIEPAVRAYRTEYGVKVIGLVPNGIFGENADFSPQRSAMVMALIDRFYENRHGAGKLVVWGDGSPLREYTYARDLARAYLWCLDRYDDAQVLNVGSTEEHSVAEIAFMIADLLGIARARIEFDRTKPAGVARKSTDNARFVALSGFRYTPFRVGLEHTVKWYCDNIAVPGAVRR